MSSNHIYHLGPCYCDNCKQFAIHYLYTSRPFFGVGPYSPYNLWMDAIKISNVQCMYCEEKRKLTKQDKELIKSLKDASLLSLEDERSFRDYLEEVIKFHNLINDFSEEEFKSTVQEVFDRYERYNIPYIWFENYAKIILAVLKRKVKIENILYK